MILYPKLYTAANKQSDQNNTSFAENGIATGSDHLRL
jgi:hypothetical protein